MSGIRHLLSHQIDTEKWDDCIRRSEHGLIYAFSWYLNAMAPGWEALVLNDYETVMPLTARCKWGIHYLYQPYFCAELGVFSTGNITRELCNDFLCNIPSRFRYFDICLNRANDLGTEEVGVRLRRNFLLSLATPYPQIKNGYSAHHKRKIQKAGRSSLRITKEADIKSVISMAANTVKDKSALRHSDWQRFENLYQVAVERSAVEIWAVTNQEGVLLSTAVFFHSHHYWYYILAGSTEEGRSCGAAHYLIDAFIQAHQDTKAYLDFEGSDVESLAFFYGGFGAQPIHYPALRINRLPKWISWFKKI